MRPRRLGNSEEFRRLVLNALRHFCSYNVDGKSIVAIDGQLLITVENGDVFELFIHEVCCRNIVGLTATDKLCDTDTHVPVYVQQGCQKRSVSGGPKIDKESDSDDVLKNLSGSGGIVSTAERAEEEDTAAADECNNLDLSSVELLGLEQHDCGLKDVILWNTDKPYPSPGGMCTIDVAEECIEPMNATENMAIDSTVQQQPNVFVETNAEGDVHSGEGARHISIRRSEKSPKNAACRKRKTVTKSFFSGADKVTLAKRRRRLLCAEAVGTDGHEPVNDDSISEKKTSSKRRILRPGSSMYECPECPGVMFESMTLYKKHRYANHIRYRCRLCDLPFFGRTAYNEHNKTTHPGISCYQLMKHLVCEHCSASFSCRPFLDDHIASKHLGRIYRCDVCDKLLGSAVTLRIHKRQQHDPDRRVTCEACGRQYGRPHALLTHFRTSHPDLLTEDQKQYIAKRLTCSYCGIDFSHRSSLKHHVRIVHERLSDQLACPHCARVYSCRRYLNNHIRMHHPSSVVKCELT